MSKLSKKKVTKKKNLNKIFVTAEKFFHSVNKNDKFVIIHDSDADGVCSAVVTLFALKKIGIKRFVVLSRDPELIRRYGVRYNFLNKTIILDLSADLFKKDLKEIINGKKDILIFDHHFVWKVKSKNIFYVNPRILEKEIYMPVSYLVFKFLSRHVNLRDVEWVAALGTIADYGIEDTKDLIGKYLNRKNYKNILDAEFWKAGMILNSSISIIGAEKTLKMMMKLKNFKDFKKNIVFKRAMKKFELELKKKEKEMLKSMEYYPKIRLRFSIINPKYRRIASALATKWGMRYINSIFILLEKTGNIYKVHGRSTSDASIADVFRKLGIGGGHPRSGGGSIKVKELKEFRMSLIKEIGKMKRIARKKR